MSVHLVAADDQHNCRSFEPLEPAHGIHDDVLECHDLGIGKRNAGPAASLEETRPGGRAVDEHSYVTRGHLLVENEPSELPVGRLDLRVRTFRADPRHFEAIGPSATMSGPE